MSATGSLWLTKFSVRTPWVGLLAVAPTDLALVAAVAFGVVIGRVARARRVALRAAGRRRELDQSLLAVSRRAVAAPDIGEMFAVTARAVSGSVGAPLVRLVERPADAPARVAAHVGWTDAAAAERLDERTSPSAVALRENTDTLVLADLTAHPLYGQDACLRAEGARAALVCLLAGQERPLGTVAVFDRVVRAWTEDEVAYVRGVAAVLAACLTREAVQRQVLHAERMDALGRLSGTVAHHFNNLLAEIYGHAEELEASARDADSVETLAALRGSAQRAAALSNQMLVFSRGRLSERRAVDLTALVGTLADELRDTLPAAVRVECALPDTPVVVLADPGELRDAVRGLVANAVQAMPDGGTVGLRVLRPDNEPHVVAVEVADDGVGMSPHVLARACEPLYSEWGRAGAGLATVYGTVRNMGGSVGLHSAAGRGTRVVLRLPLPPGDARSG